MEKNEIMIRCCRCRRVRVEHRWVREDEVIKRHPIYSHSYCPACMDQVHAEISSCPAAAPC